MAILKAILNALGSVPALVLNDTYSIGALVCASKLEGKPC